MGNDTALKEDLARWFRSGDERAHRRAYEDLRRRLRPPREVVKALGNGAVDEVRQEVLAKLLAPDRGKLRDATSPVGLALKAWQNDLRTELRKWGRRATPSPEVVGHFRQAVERPGAEAVEVRMDAKRAVEVAAELEGKGRLAVLLTTHPDRIADSDWAALAASLPPPPPTRPRTAMDRDEASKLLYPPRAPETNAARYQRLNSFDKVYRRAIASIRKRLGVDR